MPRTVFTLTFIPRVRFFGPVLAGALKLKWFAFFLADGSAQVIHTAAYVCLGYFFHKSLKALFKQMTVVHDVIFIAAIVVIGVIVGVMAAKRWSAGKRGA
jgi:membrane protein DedA with SNARE-associated domain